MIAAENHTGFDVNSIRKEFPILKKKVNGRDLVYLDNAATTQKPESVINAIADYYRNHNSNIHRAAHSLAAEATEAYENSRLRVAEWINAATEEINFTRGTTEAINLVATCWCSMAEKGSRILISGMEHHSNIVPWQIHAEKNGLIIDQIPVNANGELNMDAFNKLLERKPAMVAVNYISNALGTINPVKEITELAHKHGALVLIDAAQAAPHRKIDVKDLDADFLAFSGHKMYGPTGIGVLYGKRELLEKLPPYQGGGEMIKEVSFEGTTYTDLPYKFEAGTPNIAGAMGLAAAIDFLAAKGVEEIAGWEDGLLRYAWDQISTIYEVELFGRVEDKAAVLSFNVKGIHHYDLGSLLDGQGIAIRTGHHCCQPLMHGFGIEGTCRASFAMYNTKEEVDLFITALKKAISMLK